MTPLIITPVPRLDEDIYEYTLNILFYSALIHKAEEGEYEEAKKLIEEGNEHYAEGHKAHVEMIQKEASGESVETCLLLIHAEDQMMSAETFQVLAGEFIKMCKMINK